MQISLYFNNIPRFPAPWGHSKSYTISLDQAFEGLTRISNSGQGNASIVVMWAQPRHLATS